MKKMTTRAIFSAVLLLASPVIFACDYPSRPNDLPNGATASKDEMMAGVKMINTYQASMSEYLSCIEADEIVASQAIDSTDKDAKLHSKEMFNKKYNAAVDEQTLWVEELNTQIRAYKAKAK
jgi:hypothetical protein